MASVTSSSVYRDSAGHLFDASSTGAASTASSAALSDILYQQLTAANLASVQRLAPPTGATMAHVQSNGGTAVRYRGDGVDPTPMIGMLLEPGDSRDFTGDLTKVAFIDQGTNAVLDVTYYG